MSEVNVNLFSPEEAKKTSVSLLIIPDLKADRLVTTFQLCNLELCYPQRLLQFVAPQVLQESMEDILF